MKYSVFIIFIGLSVGAAEISPLWKVIDYSREQITGVTKDGNGLCLKNGKADFGTNMPSSEELINALGGKAGGCLNIESLPDSDFNAYQCEDSKVDCSKEFADRLNKEFNCDLQIDKVLPQKSEGKKLGSIVLFKSKNCRLSLLSHNIPCANGLTSRYLSPDQKGYKICFKASAAGKNQMSGEGQAKP